MSSNDDDSVSSQETTDEEMNSFVTDIFTAASRNDDNALCMVLKKAVTYTDEEGYNIMFHIASYERCEHSESNCSHTKVLDAFKKSFTTDFRKQLESISNDGKLLMHIAIQSDCIHLLAYLDKENCSLDDPGEIGITPLGLATEWGLTNSIRYLLLSEKCNLKYRDKNDCTPFMQACYNLRIETAEMFLQQAGREAIQDEQTNGRDAFELILMSRTDCQPDNKSNRCKHVMMLELIRNSLGEESFNKRAMQRSIEGCSSVQFATASDCNILLQFLLDQGCKLDEQDNDGDTPLGEAALLGKCKALKFLVQKGSNLKKKSKGGETPFLSACRGLQFKAAKFLADNGANTKAKDYSGNTALHLICSNRSEEKSDIEEFLSLFEWLSELKNENEDVFIRKMRSMNLSRHNVLMTLADSGNLHNFLKLEEIEFLKKLLSKLFKNEDGLNVLHIHVAKYDLQKLHCKFKDSPFAGKWEKLIKGRVTKGHYKGYGCLHFACQTGHLQNINYLLTNYADCMTLKQRLTNNCPSAMDVLMKHRHDHLLCEIQSVSFQQLIESVDNVQNALSLPSPEDAALTLVPLCDPDLKGVVMRPHKHRNEQYTSGRSANAGGGEISFSNGVRLYYMALKEDSVEIFRCIVALGFWNYLSTRTAVEDFNKYICHLITNSKTKDATVGARDVLPSLQKGFNHYLSWRPDSNKGKDVCFDLPSPSLLGIAIRSGRINIAKDIILLDQFQLIPTCLLVIEECRFLIEEDEVLRECVEDLHNFALNVALNAMDELDKNADKERLKLLHKYMGGRFHPSVQHAQCGIQATSMYGPKFACFGISEKHEHTLLELAVDSGSKEIVASNCFTNFVRVEWKKRSLRSAFRASPMTKFYLHMIFFIMFLGLLSYYVCSLESRIKWIDMVMYMFALSFVLQEFFDFCQTITKTSTRNHGRIQLRLNLKAYFLDIWNWTDTIGIVSLIVGLSLKCYWDTESTDKNIVEENYFKARMVLTTSHLIFSLRFLSFLRSFKLLGPSISMLKTLLWRDLVPFLFIFLTMCLSFGVFFFNLLHPDNRTYSSDGAVGNKDLMNLFSIYTRPLLTAFGEMEMEELAHCDNQKANWSNLNTTNNPSDATCTHPIGTFHYRKYLMLPFLFLINLVMLNMLIAKFSLTVSSKEDVSYMIWRRYDATLLMDFKRSPTMPPPLTVVWGAVAVVRRLIDACCGGRKCGTSRCPCCHADLMSTKANKQMWWNLEKLEKQFARNLAVTPPVVLDSRASDHDSDRLSDSVKFTPENQQVAAAIGTCDDFLWSFMRYVIFQACTFRDKRREFSKPRKDHGSVMEKLKVDIQKLANR